MFRESPEHKAARLERRDARSRKIKERYGSPLEGEMNRTALLHRWPQVNEGVTDRGSRKVAGAHAELFNANAHKGWTATRLAGNTVGVMTLGLVPIFSGRKNKGAAAINITYADGFTESYNVKPQHLEAANRYVTAFNARARA